MDLKHLLPNSTNRKKGKSADYLMYVMLVEWGWSWNDLDNIPLPLVFKMFRVWKEIKEKERKASKRKK